MARQTPPQTPLLLSQAQPKPKPNHQPISQPGGRNRWFSLLRSFRHGTDPEHAATNTPADAQQPPQGGEQDAMHKGLMDMLGAALLGDGGQAAAGRLQAGSDKIQG